MKVLFAGPSLYGTSPDLGGVVLRPPACRGDILDATRNGATLLKINDAGTLEAGKSADFIVLDANPIDDIKNTRKISAVYLRGAQVTNADGRR